ncbi:MAG: hypothetical protein ACFFDH_04035 [Promethearchaeota archaeon]
MKKGNKSLISILLIFFMVFAIIPSFYIIPSAIQTIINFDTVDNQKTEPKSSQFIPRTIRVAIYNEPNITDDPDYVYGGTITNNYTALQSLLIGAGYQVNELTCNDIYSHELKTADYDVFIMANNNPRENITNLVKEFWLGGGGIMSFDSAINYICYVGMLPPESEGSNGFGVYWHYMPASTTQNITARHPITKDYQINDTLVETDWGWAAFDWTALQSTSIASNITKLATKQGYSNEATVVAYDPHLRGGRVVQMLGEGDIIGENMENIIIDAIDWLCPRPKGRILFDISHMNTFGVDSWDYPDYVTWNTGIYSVLRDNLVNRSYTFDKLYPSASGNLTANNLVPYDMLIINLPYTNFTASEMTSVINWVNNGGGLLVLGDSFTFGDGSLHLNYLLSSTGLSLIDVGATNVLSTSFEHPTEEGCTSLEMSQGIEVNYTGNAFPLWGNSLTEICIAGEKYGNGRIILSGDMLLSDDRINDGDNLQFGINVANWLTACQAEVLIYIVNAYNPDPNDNEYKGPVATALNDLKIPFYLTFDIEYFNLSLYTGDFKLVVFDQSELLCQSYFADILDFMKSGGSLILSTWQYFYSEGDDLWDYLGFYYDAGDIIWTPPDLYIWDNSHPIFNFPANYTATTLNTTIDFTNRDMDEISLHNNATAIAGLTSTPNNDGAAIVLGAGGRAITNTMLLTEYYNDTDDSTYPDALEIWENEIAYMFYQSLSVDIDTPLSGEYFGTTAPSFSLTIDGIIIDEMYYTLEGGPKHSITSTSGTINQSAWSVLPDGFVLLNFSVEDRIGNIKSDIIQLVKDTQPPGISIQSPTPGSVFNASAPLFEVFITDLSVESSWYTLDEGLHNYTITSPTGIINQTAWDALSDGALSFRVYANDSAGNIDSWAVIIEKDTQAPVIIIYSPTSGEEFGSGVPTFNITVTDAHLDTIWYTVDSNTSTFSIINQLVWDDIPEGDVTITVYANDTVGNSNNKVITISKNLPSRGIGLDYFITGSLITLFSFIAIIVVIIKICSNKRIIT